MKRSTRCAVLLCLLVAIMCSFALPAFADNPDYLFEIMGDQSRKYRTSTASNKKTIKDDPATVKVSDGTSFPPNMYVWAFRMYYHTNRANPNSDARDQNYTQATNAIFVRAKDIYHPTYLAGENVTGRFYYVGARLDDRVKDAQIYRVVGKFNADDTMPN